jgi:small subunit ribosomal protein S3Ae
MPKQKEETTTSVSKRRAKKTIDKWKAKQWFEIHAPSEFDSIYIGQSPSADEELLKSRILENSLYDFTQDFNDASIKLRFKITEVNGNLCNTMFVGHELTRDLIRSLVRRGSNRIQAVLDVKTKDGAVFHLTGTVFTYALAKSSQQKTIRKIMVDILTEQASKMEFKEFVKEMVFGNIERDIKRISNEIVPIRECRLLKSVLLTSPLTIQVTV